MYNEVLVGQYLKLLGFNGLNNLPKSSLTQLSSWLSHNEERKNSYRDQWGNWDYPFTMNDFTKPYTDIFAKGLVNEIQSSWPKNAPFAICLTHDLDNITSSAHPPIAINNLKKRIFLSKNRKMKFFDQISLMKQIVKKNIFTTQNNPLWRFEDWLSLENSFGFKSTFFVFVRPDYGDALSIYDCNYNPNDLLVFDGVKMKAKDFWEELHQRGFEVGLHGSYHSSSNKNILQKQKNILEDSISSNVISTRQHYLHYDINTTPSIHSQCGIKVDSTLGFNRTIGFRAGTSFPYELLDSKGKETGVWEIPQIIMDGALFAPNALELNVDLAVKHSLKIMDQVENVGGCLTLNFHPEYIINDKYWNTYKIILQEAKRRGAYNNTVGGIYNYIQNKFIR